MPYKNAIAERTRTPTCGQTGLGPITLVERNRLDQGQFEQVRHGSPPLLAVLQATANPDPSKWLVLKAPNYRF